MLECKHSVESDCVMIQMLESSCNRRDEKEKGKRGK